jgi:hypothetical protein
MRWWVCVPGALVPAEVARHAVRALPTDVIRMVTRASVDSVAADAESSTPHLSWLWRRFGGEAYPVVAPYLWSMYSGDSTTIDTTLWCCDPVHFALARDHMLVNRLDAGAPPEAVAELMKVGATVAELHDARIVEQRGHWFLRTETPWHLSTTALDGALGRSLTECWPEGQDARRWRRLLTEIQVEWHQHPINEQRTEQGQPEINGLWLHGSGVRVPLSNHAFASVVCDDARLNAWAHAAGVPFSRRLGNDGTPKPDGDAITLITDLLPAFNADDWGEWMLRWTALAASLAALSVRAHEAGFDLTLQLFGAAQSRAVTLAAADRWRFWRGSNPTRAAELLTDAPA